MNKKVVTSSGMSVEIIENVWTGKVSIIIDGHQAKKTQKNFFTVDVEGESHQIYKKGNILFGMTLSIDKETYDVTTKLTPFEIIMAFIPVVFVFLGGAVGGFFGALAIIINVYVIRNAKSLLEKIIVPLVVSGITYVIVIYVASFILSLIQS